MRAPFDLRDSSSLVPFQKFSIVLPRRKRLIKSQNLKRNLLRCLRHAADRIVIGIACSDKPGHSPATQNGTTPGGFIHLEKQFSEPLTVSLRHSPRDYPGRNRTRSEPLNHPNPLTETVMLGEERFTA